jgi:hypothetical protein
MKKLVIAACAVAFAACVQAASITWGTSGAFYDIAGEEGGWATVAEGTTAYFVFASSYSQSDLVADYAAGSADMAKLTAINTGTVGADGTIANVTGSSTTLSGSQAAYVVLFDSANNMFISESTSKIIDELAGSVYGFNESLTGDIWANNGDASAGFKGAGWYSAAAVPEPTSGLLLLLGMAGLALRRKQA